LIVATFSPLTLTERSKAIVIMGDDKSRIHSWDTKNRHDSGVEVGNAGVDMHHNEPAPSYLESARLEMHNTGPEPSRMGSSASERHCTGLVPSFIDSAVDVEECPSLDEWLTEPAPYFSDSEKDVKVKNLDVRPPVVDPVPAFDEKWTPEYIDPTWLEFAQISIESRQLQFSPFSRSRTPRRVETICQFDPPPPPPPDPETAAGYPLRLHLSRWRQIFIMFAIFVGLFLSFLDVSIVAVALATISNDFGEFQDSTWVFTGYMLTYMAFGIILSRLRDIVGMLTIEALSIVLFSAASLGCALSENMTQLIAFRVIQWIGGNGLFSLTVVIGIRAIKPENAHMMVSYVGFTQAIAVILGPVLGGAITGSDSGAHWRWIFYLNLPAGGLSLVALLIAWPWSSTPWKISWMALRRIDYLGGLLLLVFSVLLFFAFQEAGTRTYRWDSAAIIATLVLAFSALLLFVGWEYWLERREKRYLEPVFPVKLLADRVLAAASM
jgi:MFS family permease